MCVCEGGAASERKNGRDSCVVEFELLSCFARSSFDKKALENLSIAPQVCPASSQNKTKDPGTAAHSLQQSLGCLIKVVGLVRALACGRFRPEHGDGA